MILVEQADALASVLPVAAFRDHLRLGRGFADDALQDDVLEGQLRAALSAIEARTGKAILQRGFALRLSAWSGLSREVLPMAPVVAVSAVSVVDADGVATVIDPVRYRLVEDTHRPCLEAAGFVLPVIPVGGFAEITFEAGFGAAWAEVPNGLSYAVLKLAAHFYERRGGGQDGYPEDVQALIAPYRDIRLFGRAW
ncbi:MAG: hypothetical protein AAFV31_01200 [Pseudomonadota bacterium]